jgi:hypothetical protein
MLYRAAAALPNANREQATAALRDQLRVIAAAVGRVPDWTTLLVDGPTEVPGWHGRSWFEWTATVSVEDAGEDVVAGAVVRDAEPVARPLLETQPFLPVTGLGW